MKKGLNWRFVLGIIFGILAILFIILGFVGCNTH